MRPVDMRQGHIYRATWTDRGGIPHEDALVALREPVTHRATATVITGSLIQRVGIDTISDVRPAAVVDSAKYGNRYYDRYQRPDERVIDVVRDQWNAAHVDALFDEIEETQ